jgi:hypothetical protein
LLLEREYREVAVLRVIIALLLCVLASMDAQAADPIALSFPVKCEMGATCFVQSYVDHDLSKGSRDYQCGSRTYDGHDGTDFRVLDLGMQRSGVEVLAAAPGRVVGARDGMADVSVRTIGKAEIAGKECGNGVVLEHDNGWRTQYCHMAKGSIRVKTGDQVAVGQAIGLVGLSGDTEFPHLHFTVRLAGAIVDPFAFGPALDSCNSGGRSLWASALQSKLDYRAREILNYGFAEVPPTMESIESGDIKNHPPNRQSAALVAYIRTIGLQQGDEQALTVNAPDGSVFSEYTPPALESNKAQYFMSAGKNRRAAAWPAGTYTVSYRVTRNGAELLRKTFDIKLD